MGESTEVPTPAPRRRPLVGVSGLVLLICAFLPTMRVCGDPTTPLEFPPAYVAYLGALVFAIIALGTAVRARRAWFTLWFAMWYATGLAWLALAVSSVDDIFALIAGILGFAIGCIVLPRFHRRRYTERGFWIGGIVHGALAFGWYALLASDHDAMWGAYVGLVAAFALALCSVLALVAYLGEAARLREQHAPAPLPLARIVVRDT